MTKTSIRSLLAVWTVAILGCTGKICHPISTNMCLGVNAEAPKMSANGGGSGKESGSGFNPELGAEVVVSQKFEQKYACDGKLLSEKKTYRHHTHPQLKINPRRNVPIDRSTFTNITNKSEIKGLGNGEALKYFRVFVEPKEWSLNILIEPLLAVVPGNNQVHYKYETCQKYDPDSDDPTKTHCSQWFTEEEGEVNIRIGLTERTESPEICRRYPTCLGQHVISHGSCEQ